MLAVEIGRRSCPDVPEKSRASGQLFGEIESATTDGHPGIEPADICALPESSIRTREKT